MRRTAGALALLAALGGCTSTRQEPDACKVCNDCKPQVPKPADTTWTQNKKTVAYANTQIAPYTRIGPSGTIPQGTAAGTMAATSPTKQTLAPGADQASTPKVMLPAPITCEKNDLEKPQDRLLAMKDPEPLPDLSRNKDGTTTRGDARTKESLSGIPSLDLPTLEKKDLPTAAANKPKASDQFVSSAFAQNQNPDGMESRHSSSPTVRLVNNKRITLNYKINDVGPSGVSGIDVWVTHDSRVWKKLDVGTQTHPPCVVEVSDEGVYGFTLLARNGLGFGKAPPQPGDVPQVWVEVDFTRPYVRFSGADAGAGGKATNILLRWSATDKNLGPRPITLSFAEQTRGPWTPITANQENSGRYLWQMPSNLPGRFFVRVEATDLAGNVGSAQSQEPIMIDMSQPTISILNVESGSR